MSRCSRRRPRQARRRVGSLRDQCETLLELGSEPVGHRTASDFGFQTVRDMDGKRILLIDDTLTTGATAQSAASALSNRGATVVGILTIGRMIKPSFSETVNEDWQRQRGPRRPFTFDRCCLE